MDTGATTHAYNKDSTGIETVMVHVTLSFDNVTATPNGIRVEYPDGNISQATHYSLLKLPFYLSRHVMSTCLIFLHQGRYSPLEKFTTQGVQPTSMLKIIHLISG